VTIRGSYLDSVVEPRISLTVVVTRFDRNSNTTSSETYSSSEVTTDTLRAFALHLLRTLFYKLENFLNTFCVIVQLMHIHVL